MKFIIPIIALLMAFVSVSYAQVDTLELNEIGTITLPYHIEKLYTQDLNGDGLKELIICYSGSRHQGIFIYSSDGTQLWQNDALNSTLELQFADFNGDSIVDIAAKCDSAIILFDWYHNSQLFFIDAMFIQFDGFAVGDVNNDSIADFVYAGHDYWSSQDSIQVNIYYGPSFSVTNGFSIATQNYDFSNADTLNTRAETLSSMKIVNFGNASSPQKAIAIYSKVYRDFALLNGTYESNNSYGGLWLVDATTFQQYHLEAIGSSEAAGVLEQGAAYIPYSICSYEAVSFDGTSHDGVRKALIKANPLGLIDSTTIYSQSGFEYTWLDWQGLAVGEANPNGLGPELCFALQDTIIEYSLAANQRVWNQSISADLPIVVGIYEADTLFGTPQVLCKCVSPEQECRFYDGINHTLSAVLPYFDFDISDICDINNDGVNEILTFSGNSLHVFSLMQATSVENDITLPDEYAIIGNYPNPFNAQTTIKYNLPKASNVKIELYDITGRKIDTIVESHRLAGANQVVWDATGKPSGIYLYRIRAGNESKTGRMVLLK
jgi:hypothetical protein